MSSRNTKIIAFWIARAVLGLVALRFVLGAAAILAHPISSEGVLIGLAMAAIAAAAGYGAYFFHRKLWTQRLKGESMPETATPYYGPTADVPIAGNETDEFAERAAVLAAQLSEADWPIAWVREEKPDPVPDEWAAFTAAREAAVRGISDSMTPRVRLRIAGEHAKRLKNAASMLADSSASSAAFAREFQASDADGFWTNTLRNGLNH